MANILSRSSKVFFAGCCVYYAMAACSAGDDARSTAAGASSSGANESDASGGGQSGMTSSSSGSGTAAASSSSSSGSPVRNAMADEWYNPGSRLKIQYYEATDGMKSFLGIWDSYRNETCYVSPHADGTMRCMPLASGAGLYADAGCTTSVVVAIKGQAAPRYGSPQTSPLRRFPVSPYDGAVYTGSPASCVSAASFYSTVSWDFYVFGAEIPSTSFVEATLKTSP